MQTDNYDWKTDHRHETPANLTRQVAVTLVSTLKFCSELTPKTHTGFSYTGCMFFLFLNVHFNWDLLC